MFYEQVNIILLSDRQPQTLTQGGCTSLCRITKGSRLHSQEEAARQEIVEALNPPQASLLLKPGFLVTKPVPLINCIELMSLSPQVNDHLNDAMSSMRSETIHASKNERPTILSQIAKVLNDIDNISSHEDVMDMIDSMMKDLEGKDE